jgi:hypothetical protein
MVSVLAVGCKVHRLKPRQGHGLLKVIKIHCTPSFGGEVKPEAPCCKILWHLKEFYEYERNIS